MNYFKHPMQDILDVLGGLMSNIQYMNLLIAQESRNKLEISNKVFNVTIVWIQTLAWLLDNNVTGS